MLRHVIFSAVLVVLMASAPAARAGLSWEVVESDETHLRLRLRVTGAELVDTGTSADGRTWQQVRLDGAHAGGEPGLPLLPRAARWIAVPPRGELSHETRVLQTRSLGQARLQPHPVASVDTTALRDEPRLREEVREAEGYERFRLGESESLGLGEVVYQRRQRMVPIQFTPVLYDAASGRVELITEAEIVVHLPRHRGISREDGRLPAAIESSVLNPEQARRWRCLSPELEQRREAWSSPPEPHSLDKRVGGVQLFDPARLQSDEIRMRVQSTGLTRVRMSDLIDDHGLPAQTLREEVRLYQKRRNEYDSPNYPTPLTVDVPLHFVGDPPADQPISPDDELVFYAFSAMDDSTARDLGGATLPEAMPIRADHYNSANVYFLAAETPSAGPWARMATDTLEPSLGSPEPSFRQRQRYSGDSGYQDNPITPQEERYHWNESDVVGLTRAVPFFHPVPGTNVDLEWSAVGYQFGSQRDITFYVEGRDARLDLLTVNFGALAYRDLHDFDGSVAVDDVEDGFLRFGLEHLREGSPARLGMFLGHVTIDYQAQYRSRSLNETTFNDATFTAGREGVDVDLEITGFDRPDLLLFDVTDGRNPVAISVGAENLRSETDGTTTLSLRVPQQAGELRRFRAATLSRLEILRNRDLERDPVRSVFDTVDDLQVLAVGPAELAETMQPWVQWRTEHDPGYGWNVGYADVQQIYDDFSGGLQSPHAIRDFAEYAYVQWGAQALVLVGDANEDARGVDPDAGPNLVPPSLHLQTFDGTELLASDKWYGFFGSTPSYPRGITRTSDLLVGRLPVADAPMLQSALAKIFAYEQPGDDDAWRTRSFWMADDAWSTDYLGATEGSYSYRVNEDEFAASQSRNADVVSAALDTIQTGELYDVDDITSQCRQDEGCTTVGCTIFCFAQRGSGRLYDQLSQGWLIVSYQGHAAFNRLAHESVLLRNGLSGLANNGRPFLFFGMGCHVSDFLQAGEGELGSPVGEYLFALPERGAIATYGSSGFEFLQPNATFMETITDAFFARGRRTGMIEGSDLRGQWLLGEVMAQAEMDLLALPAVSDKDEMVAQYNLLGDPLLRMDAALPRLRARGAAGPLEDGQELVADDGAASAAISLELIDENGIDRFEVTDSRGRSYSSQVQILDESDPRRIEAQLDLPIYPQTYDLDLVAYDGIYPERRNRRLSMSVTLGHELFVDGDPFDTGSGRSLPVGVRLPAELRLTSPVDLQEEDIGEVTLTGGTVENLAASGSQRQWTLTFDVTAERLEDQALQVELAGVVEEIQLTAGEAVDDALVIESHYPWPNPASLSDGEPIRVVAQANDAVEWARLTVYDLSGRLVYGESRDVFTGSTGQDQDRFFLTWDGRAPDGAEVANGTYFYRIEVGAGSRSTRSDMGRIVVMR